MKTILKIHAFIFFAALIAWGCKKEETKLYFTGGTPPVLTSTEGAELTYANADQVALTLNWTNPNYTFTTGVSSLDVSYNIEIDTAGSDFSNPAKKVITVNKDLSYAFLSSELNDIMLNQLGLAVNAPHTLEFRVIASLVNNTAQLPSNSIQYQATPYLIPPKVEPPASGNLYITGSATPANWMGGGDAEVPSQKFTQVSPTLYEITIDLNGGGSYLFVPVYGDWTHKYGGVGANNTNNVNGDDFKPEGGDLLAPPANGTYKIVVDFQKGKFTVTKQ